MLGFDPGDPGTKAYLSGTHRAAAPAETVARLKPLLGRFGITRVANLTGLDRVGLPVVMVCRPNARSSAVFHGKGVDLAAAKASGLMEAIETWHAEHVTGPLRRGSADELARDHALIDVAGLPKQPGASFDPGRALLWIAGVELASRTPIWLPFDIVHANSTVGAGDDAAACFAASTNGLASGNHLWEATSHALCEVMERDATSLWNRFPAKRQDETRLDLASVDDAACRAVLARLDEAALDVAVWEITSDVGVPAFLALAVERDGSPGHVGRGAGCHPAPAIALLRALTEAAQVRTTYIVGSREDIEHDDYRRDTLERRTAAARALMRPAGQPRRFGVGAGPGFATFREEVAWILDRLAAIGIGQVAAVDLTWPAFGIAVVRVVVPGLEGSDHHAGYSPGPRAQALAKGPA